MPIRPEKNINNNSRPIVDAGRAGGHRAHRSTHDGGSCGYGCGLGVDTDAEDAFGGRWSRLEAPTEHTQGPCRGHERQSDHEKEAKGAKNEALWLLRTFVGCSATAQWAAVGEAPAPQLNDRSRPRPQRGNGRE